MLQTVTHYNAPQPPLNLRGGDDQIPMFYDAEWFPSEVELFSEREDLSTAEWAEKYRYVVKSSKPGPWRNENNPPLKGVMDLIDFARKSVAIRKGVQTGGSEAAYNYLLRQMDISPHNALLVMETERKTARVVKQRVRPMLEATQKIAEKFSDNPDHLTNYSIMLRTGFTLNIGWSTSQAANSSDPVETAVFDEVDKYETAMNLEEGKDRITTYKRTGKIIFLSTPGLENGPISQEIESCEVVYDFQACCPDCGVMQVMKFENFTWPMKDVPQATDAERKKLANIIERDRLARYRCEGCGGEWDDYTRNKAVELGTWEPRHAVHERPISIGIEYPSWISPFKSLSEVAARWIRAQGNHEKLRAWYNQEAAEPYKKEQSERKEDAILALRDDRPRGLVPKDADCLMCLIDTQQKGFYYEVRAFEFGASLTSWQVREGYVESFEGLKQILYNDEYLDSEGRKWVINYAFMDSGGGTGTVPKHSRTAEVYDFCLANPGVRPLKGRQTMESKTVPKILDHYPNSKKPIPGGLTLYHINVTYFKNQLSGKLQVNPGDPGAWNLHSETTEDYGRQMCAEYMDDKGHWQCPRGKANHYWDLGVYALAAAEILQLKFKKKEEKAAAKPVRRVYSKGVKNG